MKTLYIKDQNTGTLLQLKLVNNGDGTYSLANSATTLGTLLLFEANDDSIAHVSSDAPLPVTVSNTINVSLSAFKTNDIAESSTISYFGAANENGKWFGL